MTMLPPHPEKSYIWTDAEKTAILAAIAAERERCAQKTARMRNRIERLRGLVKWASGRLHDAGNDVDADTCLRLVGDMEP